MSKDFYIRLTFAVHKVLDLFPEKEPLKYDIRKLANEILADLLSSNYNDCLDNIETLNSLFNLAETKNWVDSRNFLVLLREYNKIAQYVQRKLRISSGKPVEKSFQGKRRQNEILEILKNNGKVKVGDLIKTFPEINRRTLLRDMEGFCHVGLVEKNGHGRGACYTLRNATL